MPLKADSWKWHLKLKPDLSIQVFNRLKYTVPIGGKVLEHRVSKSKRRIRTKGLRSEHRGGASGWAVFLEETGKSESSKMDSGQARPQRPW